MSASSCSLHARRCSGSAVGWTRLLLSALCCLLLVCPSTAVVKLVVDVDGAIEDFAVLTTILRHSSAKSQLAMVTVNGNGWGSMKTAEANVKRYLQLAGKLDTIPVGLGYMRTLGNMYNASTHTTDCKGGSQGIPRTPYEAQRRNMRISRYDVDRVFGASQQLPLVSSDVLRTSTDAVPLLLNLLESLSDGDRLEFLALKSLTTLAEFAIKAQQLNLGDKFATSVHIHAYENGANWALDLDAASYVFGTSGTTGASRAAKHLYTPQLWQTSVTFSFFNWEQFERSAPGSPEAAWLHTAWRSMKEFLDGGVSTGTRFFQERGPASSLVALCVIDVETHNLCEKYQSLPTSVGLSWSNSSSNTALTFDYLSGNNITSAMFLQYPATVVVDGSTAVVPSGSSYVVDHSASFQWPGTAQSLVSLFWARWLAVLKA